MHTMSHMWLTGLEPLPNSAKGNSAHNSGINSSYNSRLPFYIYMCLYIYIYIYMDWRVHFWDAHQQSYNDYFFSGVHPSTTPVGNFTHQEVCGTPTWIDTVDQFSMAMLNNQTVYIYNVYIYIYVWLVVHLPLWKIWKSHGMIIPNIWKTYLLVGGEKGHPKKKAHKWMMIIALYAKNHDLLSRDPPSTKWVSWDIYIIIYTLGVKVWAKNRPKG